MTPLYSSFREFQLVLSGLSLNMRCWASGVKNNNIRNVWERSLSSYRLRANVNGGHSTAVEGGMSFIYPPTNTGCYGPHVCAPPKFLRWRRRWRIGRWSSQSVETSGGHKCSCKKVKRVNLLSPSAPWGYKRADICHSEGSPHQNLTMLAPLISNFQPPEWRDIFCCS